MLKVSGLTQTSRSLLELSAASGVWWWWWRWSL